MREMIDEKQVEQLKFLLSLKRREDEEFHVLIENIIDYLEGDSNVIFKRD